MRLDHLFDGELSFDDETEVAIAASGDSDWLAYVRGTGHVRGEGVSGRLRWSNHPRRREDGVWLPRIGGVIETDDGASILFRLDGYNVSLTEPFEYVHRSVAAAMSFAAADERYRWLNTVLGVVEGDVRVEDAGDAAHEVWRIRAYRCIPELV